MQIREGWPARYIAAVVFLAESCTGRSPGWMRACRWPLCTVVPACVVAPSSGERMQGCEHSSCSEPSLGTVSSRRGACGPQGQTSTAGVDRASPWLSRRPRWGLAHPFILGSPFANLSLLCIIICKTGVMTLASYLGLGERSREGTEPQSWAR